MEENQELSYFNYGNNQIEQQATLNALANNVQSYVNNQAWSTKRKQKFLDAYSDIISKGIVGANNSTGQWALDLNQEIDLSGMSPKDQEMYHEAAYYILEQMKGIPVKDSEEKKEESKDLPLYDNDTHFKAFEGYIRNQMFGGRNWNIGGDNDDWNSLDERDSKTGIRGTTNRALKLADMLEGYSNSLEDGKYNFEGTAFKNTADLKGRIANAVTQLRNGTWDQNDKDALNQIGLDWRRYFNDGSGDTAAVDANGNPISYAQLATANQAQVEEAAKSEATQKTTAAKENAGVLNIMSGFNPREARTKAKEYAEWLGRTHGVGQQGFNNVNQRIQELIEGAYTNNLNAATKKELGNLLEYIKTNNPNYQNYNLTPEEEVELQAHTSMKGRRLQDFRRLPWQTSDGRYTYADNKGNLYFLKPRNQKQLQQKPFTRSAAYNNYKNSFLKSQVQLNNEKPVLSQDTDILISDMTSMLGDIVSLGGGYAGAAGGITTLLSDLYGDIRRGKDTWSTIKNLGANVAWGAAGLIPGAKLGKLAKNAARIYATLQSAGILMNDEVQQSWKNLITGKPITAKDFENFKWTLHAITGGTNAARGHFTERNVARQVKSNNKPTIETKSGKKVTLTEDQVKNINKIGGRKGQKAAEEAFKKATGEEAKEGTFSFQENSRAWYNPNRYSQRLRNWTSDNERLVLPKIAQSVNTQAINRLLEIDRAKPIIGVGNPLNKRFWTEGGPNRGGLTFALASYRNNSLSPIQKEEIKKELKALPLLRKPYNKPSVTNQEVIPESRRLPQPGGEHKGTRIDVQRTGTSSTKNISTGEAVKEFTDFDRMYITSTRKNSKVPSRAFGNGYGTSKEPESGSLGFNGITATVTKLDGDKGFSISFGKTGDTVIAKQYKDVQQLRSDLARQLNKVIKKQHNVKETAALLRQFKAKGWLKQGGQINNFNLDKTISEFLNKQK